MGDVLATALGLVGLMGLVFLGLLLALLIVATAGAVKVAWQGRGRDGRTVVFHGDREGEKKDD